MKVNVEVKSKSKSIREHCCTCVCGFLPDVKYCNLVECALWPHRMGYSVESNRYQKLIENEKDEKNRQILMGIKQNPDPLYKG